MIPSYEGQLHVYTSDLHPGDTLVDVAVKGNFGALHWEIVDPTSRQYQEAIAGSKILGASFDSVWIDNGE